MMSVENEKRDPVSNKNDMIIDVIAEIICDDAAKLRGELLPHGEQIDTRLRLGALHDLVDFYKDTLNIQE